MAFADLTAVLIECHITDPMEAVLNGPMTAVERQDAIGWGADGIEVGEAIDRFGAGLAGLDVDHLAFDPTGLADEREIQEGIERRGGTDAALFDPAVGLVTGAVLRGE
jgi:hypothetical protein